MSLSSVTYVLLWYKCPHNSETPFEQRFQGFLQDALQQRSWHVIAAIPGSGKSLGIHDLVMRCGADKLIGRTTMPILAIRAPMAERELALGMAFSYAFGVSPVMPWNVRRIWLVREIADFRVEGIIIDDAQVLSLQHLSYLKELTDNLAAPPYLRKIALCLVVANSGNVIPLQRDYFESPAILWRQFRRRMDTERPFRVIPGHTEEEVQGVLATFEGLYRDQLPDLGLQCWTNSIFTWLTNPILDPDATRRVTMDHLARFVTSALRRAYTQGLTDVDETILQKVAEILIQRRNDVTFDEEPPDGPRT